jgi:hypothetical protein
MSRLVKLEKLLERGLDRLRRPETGRALIEAIPEVLDDVEDHLEPSGGRGRVFPYDRIVVAFHVAEADRAAARTLMQDLPERIQERLRSHRATTPAALAIEMRFVSTLRSDWGERLYKIRYRCARAGATSEPRVIVPASGRLAPLRLNVLRGRTGEKEHALALARIHLGRMEKVPSANGRGTRKNHVWFAANEDTVSRAHARIERVDGQYLLFDEGSTSGTRVLRDGDDIELMPRSSRGVRLMDGDRIELGKGCVVEVRIDHDA